MSENTPTAPNLRPPPAWQRSPDFRSFFSNQFQYRVGRGDFSLLLGAVTSEEAEEGRPTVRREAEVYMTWTQLKDLSNTLAAVVAMVEEEFGAIASTHLPDEASALHEEQLRAHVRAVGPMAR